MADVRFGFVSEVTDERKFTIKATIKELIEDVVATPGDVFDKPEVGDPIILYGLDTIFGYCWIYEKQRLDQKTRIHYGDAIIDISSDNDDATDAKITIATKDEKVKIELDADGNITIDNKGDTKLTTSGDVSIKADGDAKIDCSNAEIKSSSNTKVDASGNCEIKGTQVKVQGTQVQITGGQLQVNGMAAPTGSGPFCGIPACLFTGAPHVGSMVSGT